MKAYYLIGVIAVCAFADACQPALDINGGARSSRYVKTVYNGEDPEGNPSQKEDPALKLDTAVYFSAVEFPSGYDWKKDSACGNSTATLRLYRNYEPYANLQTGECKGIGTDPDTHHWIDGNLYTEYNLYGRTIICKNGNELFRYDDQEFLKGLLVLGDDVWTLGQNSKGKGFSLRCNGEALLTDTQGIIFGDLTSSAHEGLYVDSGKICFCYQRETVSSYNLYTVTDAEVLWYTSRTQKVHDMVITDGEVSIIHSSGGVTLYEKGYDTMQVGGKTSEVENAWLCTGSPSPLMCLALKGYDEQEYQVWDMNAARSIGKGWQIYMYPQTDGTFKYVKFSGFGMLIGDMEKGLLASCSRPGVFGRSCLKFLGDNYFLACNGSDGTVSIETNQRSVPVEVNGYVSALDIRLEKAQEE